VKYLFPVTPLMSVKFTILGFPDPTLEKPPLSYVCAKRVE